VGESFDYAKEFQKLDRVEPMKNDTGEVKSLRHHS
jgi:hypothetical protein